MFRSKPVEHFLTSIKEHAIQWAERPSNRLYTANICDAICDHETFFVTRSRPRRPISSSAGFCNANNFPNALSGLFYCRTHPDGWQALVRLTQHRCRTFTSAGYPRDELVHLACQREPIELSV